MRICGIDPGFKGALAFLESTPNHQFDRPHLLSIIDMPLLNTRIGGRKRVAYGLQELNTWQIAEILKTEAPDLVVIEQQWAFKNQGLSSSFKLGEQYGALQAICATLNLPFEIVPSNRWKGHLELHRSEKSASLDKARELLPEIASLLARAKDHNRAEAALIALWKAAYEKPVDPKYRRNPREIVRENPLAMRDRRRKPRPRKRRSQHDVPAQP
jgi:crossover junction endodeoxyribonuclease RuvC